MPKQVMIVEDNELNMKLFRDLIEASGYSTIQTRNGMDALELARRYPNIVGIKDTIPDMAHTVELIQTVKSNIPSFEVLSGFDHNFASNILAGGDGCIAAVSNVRPDLCVGWRDAMKARDFDATMKYQQLFNRIVGVYGFSSPFMAAMKGLLVDAGIFATATVASPYQEATSAQMFAVREFMRAF